MKYHPITEKFYPDHEEYIDHKRFKECKDGLNQTVVEFLEGVYKKWKEEFGLHEDRHGEVCNRMREILGLPTERTLDEKIEELINELVSNPFTKWKEAIKSLIESEREK